MDNEQVSNEGLERLIAHWRDEWEQIDAAPRHAVSTHDNIVVDTLVALSELQRLRVEVEQLRADLDLCSLEGPC